MQTREHKIKAVEGIVTLRKEKESNQVDGSV